MPLVDTSQLDQTLAQFTSAQINNIYCGLDACVTLEVFQEINSIHPQAAQSPIYQFERALQAPYLEIMNRGFCIDQWERAKTSHELRARISHLHAMLQEFAAVCWSETCHINGRDKKPIRDQDGKKVLFHLNPNSPSQLARFLYGALRLPEIWLSFKGERRLSTNREALEKLSDYINARPIINCILAIRDLSKQLQVFETEIDNDGRYRTSYNIAGTETGRPSSSVNAFGTGGNAQNIAPSCRRPFVSDPGYKLAVIDFEQVEARDVGYICGLLFNDWTFLDACEGGDLHTTNCRLIWPERPWTHQAGPDRALADEIFYRDFTFRDMSKRGGHLSNYYGSAWTMARALKIPVRLAEDFQARYCRGGPNTRPAYPCLPKYWTWCGEQLQTKGKLSTLFGRERNFFSRLNDDTTLREAIAFIPQGTTADRTNLALWRVWRYLPEVELLGQTYDSITIQYREEIEQEILPQVLTQLQVELISPGGRKYIVPAEAKVGWNWASYASEADITKAIEKGNKPPTLNLNGLKKWKPSQPDERKKK